MKLYYATTPAGDFRLFKKGDHYRVHTMMNQGAGKPFAVGGFDILTNDEAVALDYFNEWGRAQCGRDLVIIPTWV